MKTLKLFLVAVVCTTLATSCGNHRRPATWRTSDDVHIAVDETFKDIMDEELRTFAMQAPETTIQAVYCSEDSAIQMLVKDSIRCCIATRKLSDREKQIVESHKLGVSQALVAYDAFALIVNKNNTDTLVTLDYIRGIVSGKITRWEQLEHSAKSGALKFVFDNSGSSTVRFMRDSLLNGRQVSTNLYAQGDNAAVIEAVKNDPEIIGVVGTNWLKAESDTIINDFDALDVKVLKVARKSGKDEIGWKPYQYRIYSGDYPLVRPVYVILTDPRVRSYVRSFYFFLKGDKGQKIILNSSQLLPSTAVQNRAIKINE